jgi:hypothetical protein
MRAGEMGSDKPPSKKDGSPGRTRTSDPAVNSRLLYRLSYRGIANGCAEPSRVLSYHSEDAAQAISVFWV